MDNLLKNIVLIKMKERGIKIPQLSKQTGIPKERIYKWYSEGSNPKAEDSVILEKWINRNIEKSIPADSRVEEPETKYVRVDPQTQLYIDSLNKQIATLEAHCALIEKLCEQKINEIQANFQKALSNQETMLRQLAAESMLAARRYAGKDDKKYQEELERLGRLITVGR